MVNLVKDTHFAASFIRNSLIQIFWWVIFFPGFFSADSFAAVDMARTGNLTNSYTASWALYVRIFSFHGNAIGLLTLINSLLLIYALTAFTYSIFKKSTAAISSFLMTLTPLIWAMGITLWHDVLMTAGLILIVAFFTIYLRTNSYNKSQIIWQLGLGSFLATFRPNGLPTIVVFVTLLLIYKKNMQIFKLGFVGISASIIVTFITSVTILGTSPINSYFAQEWMRNDISCFANTPRGAGFVEKHIPDIGSTETWQSATSCTFLNDSKLSIRDEYDSEKYVPKAWVRLALEQPLFVIKTHSMRNAYLLPLPFFGIPKVPFLHSTIESANKEINWKFSEAASHLRIIVRLWNAMRGLQAWAGFWWLLLLLIFLQTKKQELIPALIMGMSLISLLFLVAPIPDGRYALFVLISSQIALIGKLIGAFKKLRI